jgi:hypothetical protein
VGERPKDAFCLTKNDETVKWLIIGAANEAGYSSRVLGEEEIGINLPTKVCRFVEAIHRLFVEELDRREQSNGRTTRVDQSATREEGGEEDGTDDHGAETGGDS